MKTSASPPHQSIDRYARQIRLPEIGADGQRRLAAESALIVGCGALGSTIANNLVRAGVGTIRLVDRDVVELNNLQRQALFDEDDVAAGLPKAEAAALKLRQINSAVQVEHVVTDVTPRNIVELIDGMSVVLDGTDNFETRYIINDACVESETPWIYGGVIGTTGMTMPVYPGEGPCLRCVFPTPPPTGSVPTCETAGILNTVPATIAAVQSTQALKILCGGAPCCQIVYVDMWKQSFRSMSVERDPKCPACVLRRFDYLTAKVTALTTTLCGRNAVQITPAGNNTLDLERLSSELATMGETSYNGSLMRFRVENREMLVFPDGRAMVNGTDDETLARSLYAKYVGS